MIKAKRLWGHMFSYLIKLIRNLINSLKSTVEADSTLKVNSVKSLILFNLELIVLRGSEAISEFFDVIAFQRTAPL